MNTNEFTKEDLQYQHNHSPAMYWSLQIEAKNPDWTMEEFKKSREEILDYLSNHPTLGIRVMSSFKFTYANPEDEPKTKFL